MFRYLILMLSIAAALHAEDPRPNVLFCIADDWGYPHAGVYGDKVVKTPVFDSLAKDGALFTHAYCAAPSCSPSRAAILTGQMPHRLEAGGNLWGSLPKKFSVFPDLLEATGYHIGLKGKGWGPGSLGDRTRNPAGPNYKDFNEFLKSVPKDKPFYFWFGSSDPHRPYDKGSGEKSGMKIEDVEVPPFLPDTKEVRGDILDYYFEVQRFDTDVGEMLKALETSGRSNNTIVVMTSDNGMPFPRAKTNLHDSGTRMPLAIRWPARIAGGKAIEHFVSFIDFAPSFLEAAGLKAEPDMHGRSLFDLLIHEPADRDKVFVERERHANVREGDLSYPARSIRTKQFAYIRNFRPNLWPSGDPEYWKAVGPFGDIDGGPTKDVVTGGKDDPALKNFFRMSCEKRPAEELYDMEKDPHQLHNLADDTQYAETKKSLSRQLDDWMKATNDPRANGETDFFDKAPYHGGPGKDKK